MRRLRSALLDWSLGELLKSFLGNIWRLKEIGIALPIVLTGAPHDQPPDTLDPQGHDHTHFVATHSPVERSAKPLYEGLHRG